MLTYLKVLDSFGYTGPLTIEREIAEDRDRQKADIGAAVSLLESLRDQIGLAQTHQLAGPDRFS
ncbi:MAG: hypothetical protein CM1200mP2_27150 [Planctomycetaceae bacterium]|nr:MAG: hypothetical protein CM1200mP2_27150 [Planctomycetaceae bacterium]